MSKLKALSRLMCAFFVVCCCAVGPLAPFAGAAKKTMPFRIDVDLVNQIVTVYTNDDDSQIVLQCLCSSGAKDATPTGNFKMPQKERDGERQEWFHFRAFGGYARYASRIVQDIMFHSLLYSRPNVNSINKQSVEDFGKPVSHGCIRLRVEDAQFIAENCLPGTMVHIHKDNERDEELRSLLYQSSFNVTSGQNYDEFYGIPTEEGALGKGSCGKDVKDLQLRLKDLGIFNEDITGNYTLSTVRAVREAQELLGVEQTGIATADFQSAIAQADAPSSMNVTQREGNSGPAVRALQTNLQALRLYDGDIDSVFDVDVTNAVTLFQSVYGFEPDGVATPIVQKAIYYEGEHVKGIFSNQPDYQVKVTDRKFYFGKVNCHVGIKLRKEPSTKAEALMSLKNGDTVIGLEYGKEWSKVMKNEVTGYVMNSFMEYTSTSMPILEYMGPDGQVRYTIGYTSVNDNPAEKFEDYLASGGSLDDHEHLSKYATVNTGTGQPLNMRGTPSSGGDVVATIPDGTDLEVALKSSDWALVNYGGEQGYVMSQYLEYWMKPDEEASASDEDEDAVVVYEDDSTESATTMPRDGDAAPVYESNDESSPVVGSLPRDIQVDVIETVEGWSLIEYKGHRGYMHEDDLQFKT